MELPLARLVAVCLVLALARASELQREARTRNHVCSTWGDFHYKTFDGDVFRFPGLCDYNFASDCRDSYKEFAVHLKRGLDQAGGHPRIESILITIKDDTIYLTHKLAVVNGAMVSTPHYSSGLLIEKNDAYTKVYSRAGLSLMWNREDALMLELDSRFQNHTCGLCGDFNGMQTYNEFLSEGIQYSAIEFGNMQKINKPEVECEDPEVVQGPESCSEHRAECERLLTSTAFDDCQARVPMELYVRACMQDRCRCPQGGACECSTLAEFSRQCSHAGGRPQNWRTASLCPKKCPGNMVYLESSSPCVDTCSHLEVSSLCEEHYMDGCFCPEGTVYDDITGSGCIPVSKCHCKLHGHLYMPGQEITNNCEQCVCNAGRWVCEELSCPETCALEGGSHITTFDGKKFTFHGDCYYVLTKGSHNDSYALLGELATCGSTDKQTCLKTVVLLTDNKKNVVAFKSGGSVLLNELEVTLPHVAASFSIFQPSSYHIVVNTVFGLRLQVQLVPVMQLFVTLDQAAQGQVQGLCGNFNGLESDDFMTSGGLVEATGAGFANTWKAQSSCHDKLDWLDDPCSLNIESANYAEHWCSLLKKSETPFARCHLAVDPTEYYKRCKYDTCNCQNNEDCMCAALSSYARACAAKGVMLWGWRERVCNKDVHACPSSQIFLYNLTTCQQTCRSLSEGDTHCLKGFAPVEGCGCPDHTFMDEKGRCVPLAKCSCYHHGLYLEAGDVILRQEERCICRNGRLQCTQVKLIGHSCKAPKILVDCNNLTALATRKPRPTSCQTLVAGYYHTECISGCVCPDGLLDDGHGDCVKEEDCPCIHNKDLYKPGDEIKLDCNNTCTCQKGRWECTRYACHSTCSIYGSGHYITFDGKHYDFDGHCSYVAVQDYCGQNSTGSFSIITENVPCGTTGVTCSKAIKIFIGGTELKLVDKHRVIKQLEEGHHVPFITREVGLYLVVEASSGIIVIWDKRTTIFIKLAPSYKGTVCGLCGNFDDQTKNDFTTRDHMVVTSELDFGNSWKEASTCPDVTHTPDPCSLNPHRRSWAEKQCSIIKSGVFKGCHSKVDPTVFYEACVHDSCSCDTGGDCECFCSAVASYAQECTKAEACVFWRTPDLCPVFCDYYNPPDECEWHYEPCGNRTFETCRTINGIHSNISVSYLEGCYPRCPKDRPIYDEDLKRCVTEDKCGCYIEDTRYPPNASVPTDDICMSCICTNTSEIICRIDEGKIVNQTQDGIFCYWEFCGPNGTVEKHFNICASSTAPPSTLTSFTTISTPTPISTTTTTTTITATTATATPTATASTPTATASTPTATASTPTATASTPTATASTPTATASTATATASTITATTTVTMTTTKVPCCFWSDWINNNRPSDSTDGGERETFDSVCSAPEDIECRSATEPKLSWEELDQKVQCNVSVGFICRNEDQYGNGDGVFGQCYDYEIRVYCCYPREYCTTPTTSPTTSPTTLSTSSPSTSPTTTPTTSPTTTPNTSPTTTSTTSPTTTPTTSPTTTPTTSPTTTPTTSPTTSLTTTPTTSPTTTSTTSPTTTPTTSPTTTPTTSPTTSLTTTPTTSPTTTSTTSPTTTPTTSPTTTPTTSPTTTPTTSPTTTPTISPTTSPTTTLMTSFTTSQTSSSTTSPSSSPTPSTTTTPTTSPGTLTTTSPSTISSTLPTTSTPTTPCIGDCKWTGWKDSGKPTYDKESGDFELIGDACEPGWIVANISCRAVMYSNKPLDQLGQKVICDKNVGLVCRNSEQEIGGIIPMPVCLNYEINVECCSTDCTTTTQTSTITTVTSIPTSTSTVIPTPPSTTTETSTSTSTATETTTPTPHTSTSTSTSTTTKTPSPTPTTTVTSTPTATTTETPSPTPTTTVTPTPTPTTTETSTSTSTTTETTTPTPHTSTSTPTTTTPQTPIKTTSTTMTPTPKATTTETSTSTSTTTQTPITTPTTTVTPTPTPITTETSTATSTTTQTTTPAPSPSSSTPTSTTTQTPSPTPSTTVTPTQTPTSTETSTSTSTATETTTSTPHTSTSTSISTTTQTSTPTPSPSTSTSTSTTTQTPITTPTTTMTPTPTATTTETSTETFTTTQTTTPTPSPSTATPTSTTQTATPTPHTSTSTSTITTTETPITTPTTTLTTTPTATTIETSTATSTTTQTTTPTPSPSTSTSTSTTTQTPITTPTTTVTPTPTVTTTETSTPTPSPSTSTPTSTTQTTTPIPHTSTSTSTITTTETPVTTPTTVTPTPTATTTETSTATSTTTQTTTPAPSPSSSTPTSTTTQTPRPTPSTTVTPTPTATTMETSTSTSTATETTTSTPHTSTSTSTSTTTQTPITTPTTTVTPTPTATTTETSPATPSPSTSTSTSTTTQTPITTPPTTVTSTPTATTTETSTSTSTITEITTPTPSPSTSISTTTTTQTPIKTTSTIMTPTPTATTTETSTPTPSPSTSTPTSTTQTTTSTPHTSTSTSTITTTETPITTPTTVTPTPTATTTETSTATSTTTQTTTPISHTTTSTPTSTTTQTPSPTPSTTVTPTQTPTSTETSTSTSTATETTTSTPHTSTSTSTSTTTQTPTPTPSPSTSTSTSTTTQTPITTPTTTVTPTPTATTTETSPATPPLSTSTSTSTTSQTPKPTPSTTVSPTPTPTTTQTTTPTPSPSTSTSTSTTTQTPITTPSTTVTPIPTATTTETSTSTSTITEITTPTPHTSTSTSTSTTTQTPVTTPTTTVTPTPTVTTTETSTPTPSPSTSTPTSTTTQTTTPTPSPSTSTPTSTTTQTTTPTPSPSTSTPTSTTTQTTTPTPSPSTSTPTSTTTQTTTPTPSPSTSTPTSTTTQTTTPTPSPSTSTPTSTTTQTTTPTPSPSTSTSATTTTETPSQTPSTTVIPTPTPTTTETSTPTPSPSTSTPTSTTTQTTTPTPSPSTSTPTSTTTQTTTPTPSPSTSTPTSTTTQTTTPTPSPSTSTPTSTTTQTTTPTPSPSTSTPTSTTTQTTTPTPSPSTSTPTSTTTQTTTPTPSLSTSTPTSTTTQTTTPTPSPSTSTSATTTTETPSQTPSTTVIPTPTPTTTETSTPTPSPSTSTSTTTTKTPITTPTTTVTPTPTATTTETSPTTPTTTQTPSPTPRTTVTPTPTATTTETSTSTSPTTETTTPTPHTSTSTSTSTTTQTPSPTPTTTVPPTPTPTITETPTPASTTTPIPPSSSTMTPTTTTHYTTPTATVIITETPTPSPTPSETPTPPSTSTESTTPTSSTSQTPTPKPTTTEEIPTSTNTVPTPGPTSSKPPTKPSTPVTTSPPPSESVTLLSTPVTTIATSSTASSPGTTSPFITSSVGSTPSSPPVSTPGPTTPPGVSTSSKTTTVPTSTTTRPPSMSTPTSPTVPISTTETVTQTRFSSTTPTTLETTRTSSSGTVSVSPITSPSTSWTSTATVVICCVLNGTFYGPGELVYNNTLGDTCYYVNCSLDCEIQFFNWSCPSTPSTSTPLTPTSPLMTTPSTPSTTSSKSTPSTPKSTSSKSTTSTPTTTRRYECQDFDPPRQVNETWWLCNCTMAICKYDNVVEIVEKKCDPPPMPTCSNGLKPVRVVDPDGCCWHWECDCYCTGWGDPHFVTFDGLYYSYQGNCTYVLVEEIVSNVDNFGVYIDNYHCDVNDQVSCPRTLIVRHETQEVQIKTVHMMPIEVQVQVNKQVVALPYKKYGLQVYESGINFMVDIPRLGAQISYNGLSFSIRLPYQKFGNNTKGQCGTCTNNTADDCILPSGEIISDCEVAADQWLVIDPSKPHCPHNDFTTKRPAITTPGLLPKNCTASPICQLIKDSLFSECHPFVPPKHYYEACLFDSCFVPGSGMECASVQAYAALCAKEGTCIDWRNHTQGACSVECPSHRVYQACAPAEEPTCQSSSSQNATVLVEGCFCPEGTTKFAPGYDVCVKTCGCVGPDYVPREFGEHFEFDCKDCVCLEGGSGIVCQAKKCAGETQTTCEEDGTYLVEEVNPDDKCCNITSCKCDTKLCKAEPPSCLLGFEAKSQHVPGKCCPVYSCEPKGVCVHQNAEYQPGSPVHSTKCQDCVCTNTMDNNTQVNIISCTHVPCNISCSSGFELVEVPGECCRKCQQTHCIMEGPNQQYLILKPGDIEKNPNDKCTFFSCIKINNQLISSVSNITCPDFNPSDCVPGSITYMPNGCCQTCIPKNHTTAPCSVTPVMKEISHNGCTKNVSMNYCSGACGTFAMYSAQVQDLDHKCSCCKEERTSQRQVTLECPDGSELSHTYTHIESCLCQDTVCMLPQAQQVRVRRSSPRFLGRK